MWNSAYGVAKLKLVTIGSKFDSWTSLGAIDEMSISRLMKAFNSGR